jgi:hypothetical protein
MPSNVSTAGMFTNHALDLINIDSSFALKLVRLSRTKWLRGRKTLGNLIFWLGIFTGPSLLCSLYLIL